MSLHAELSPEAQEKLNAQRRISTITSFIIALLVMGLIAVILLIISLKLFVKEVPVIVSYNAGSEENENLEVKKVNTNTQRKPSAPSSSMAKVIAANTTSPTAIPVPEVDVPDPSLNFGDGDDFGSGWGDGGDGGGGGFGNIPALMKKRCSQADRLSRLTSNGGNEKCEEAVMNGLRWLKGTQAKDGSWTSRNQVGMTGLAILAYLGHCETTQSEEFGLTVLNGLTYLINVGKKNKGKIASDFQDKHWVYEHSIAVYALAEAYSLCTKSFGENIPELENTLLAAGQYLIDNQHKSGGWDYRYDEDSTRGGDTSIVGWHLQALKAMKVTKLGFRNLERAARKGIEYFSDKQNSEGAVGYTNNNPNSVGRGCALGAVGALSYQIWDKSSANFTRKACRYIDKNYKFEWKGADSDLYGHYYAAQAMINNGGEYWKRYNKKFRDQTLNNQNENGSWNNVGPSNAVTPHFSGTSAYATHYRSCLAILMLETYYRFLPATGAKSR